MYRKYIVDSFTFLDFLKCFVGNNLPYNIGKVKTYFNFLIKLDYDGLGDEGGSVEVGRHLLRFDLQLTLKSEQKEIV